MDVLPSALAEAALQVAKALQLSDNWLNTGTASLMDFGLPPGWQDRIQVRRYAGLEVQIPSRFDQICFKLYAVIDRGPNDKHFKDLQSLEPSPEELTIAAHWTTTHDPSDAFRRELIECLASMGVDIKDADF